jgi:adenine-specific DNA-methyltransferase
MDRSTLQQKLNQPYTTDNWREIVQHVFPNVQIFSPPQAIPVNNDKVETFRQLGNVTLQDGKTLALFELKLKSNVNILRNRVELNTIVSQYIDQERTHGVLSIFEQGTDDYRFTFSARATEYDEESGDFNTKKTDTKRYTYVLGRNESCKTPAARFADLAQKKSSTDIQAIQDAFSVEKLSKEFFKEYKQHYQKMVDYLLATDVYKRVIFNGDEKAVRDFAKLLMGRLVFIQFVQKKRWMGVPADVPGWHDGPSNFLYQSYLDFEYKETFYSAFLEPLFYDTLNTPNRPGDLFSVTGTKVPYLNGGLFEKGEMDTSLINFPENYFAELLDFFDRYNFTIDENDLSEKEVGIDPEMLGHIFENLLEDNKDKGAFYTPKEIVHYMCQESLKEYLKTQLESHGVWPSETDKATELEQSLEAFVKRKEAAGVIDHDGILAKALRDVKICDPAIGSGAFPMGLLTEIFRCMYVLYFASPDTVGEIWDMEAWQPETVKKNIIQNSIYGVDIERGAVDIARLRFWLSLIVDEPEPHALPNLDYKIVVGNSLVSKWDDEVIDIDWERKRRTTGDEIYVAQINKLLNELSIKQKQYFESSTIQRKKEIRNLKIEILANQLKLNKVQFVQKNLIKIDIGLGLKPIEIKRNLEINLEVKRYNDLLNNLEKIKLNDSLDFHFFDWKLDFPEVMNENVTEKVGFDIVIGNPPYIQLQKMGKETRHLTKSWF